MSQSALLKSRTARAQERQQRLLERRREELADAGGMSRHERLLEVRSRAEREARTPRP